MLARTLALLGAAAAWAGLGAQLFILMSGPLGAAAALWRFFAYFTILMNVFAACLLTLAFVRPALSSLRAQLHSAAAVFMAVGCAVYALILQDLWDPQGLQLFADVALHYVAPIVTILFWFVAVPKSALRWRDAFVWTSAPLFYFVYAMIRASGDGFYPYPFIDVAALGWTRVLTNAAGMLVVFLVVGFALVAIARTASKRAPVIAPS